MSAYTVAAVGAVVVTVVVDQVILRTRLLGRRVFWTSYAIILFFQLVTNGVLTGVRIVRYDPGVILGWRVAWAPVEDILFGFALVTLTLSSWVWLGRRGYGRPASASARSGPPAAGGGSAR